MARKNNHLDVTLGMDVSDFCVQTDNDAPQTLVLLDVQGTLIQLDDTLAHRSNDDVGDFVLIDLLEVQNHSYEERVERFQAFLKQAKHEFDLLSTFFKHPTTWDELVDENGNYRPDQENEIDG